MQEHQVLSFLQKVLKNVPFEWLDLTTHRLDIYNEQKAKTRFIDEFETLFESEKVDTEALGQLPTAYDYIRLGHPLSSVLEWGIAKKNQVSAENVISFSSATMPIMAVLRKNSIDKKKTRIVHQGDLPKVFDISTIKRVYGYEFEILKINDLNELENFEGSTLWVAKSDQIADLAPLSISSTPDIDFYLHLDDRLGSIMLVAESVDDSYIKEIQHVRRRESIAMTPANCYTALLSWTDLESPLASGNPQEDHAKVIATIRSVTQTATPALLGSSGLSIQYAIMMGLIDEASQKHPGKDVRFLIPPNCYGGTNDQARRVAASLEHVEVVDLPVDRQHNMVDSLDKVLDQVAMEDAIPYIIVEIPTNPRVEVPVVKDLRGVLKKPRKTASDDDACEPVFIIDQTFCPNVPFLREAGAFPDIKTIVYVSGSKFPSGGKCTAGYCTANAPASEMMESIEQHLNLCDNKATELQVAILAEQMPSMIQRIREAYDNTQEFVDYIKQTLSDAKINFVSESLVEEGFTPSVFSLDLPTKGNTDSDRETHKRALNDKLIKMMITEIPQESKYCVSYGQLKGCYWTIPATSTQGTTKEEDKDYIARVAVSPALDLDRHKEVFKRFVAEMK